ncbi:hypothetical protein [Campylobacter lari]|uniref:hypothetical protein n=1 Tax=Campylobacter lari TaxID=201 RepID=UPI0021522409|nr:hypothetical protein [Campylobacter lari]MCR6511427.1 hypothetical protein [Campylobacter lari]MCR6528477.1 hypothetical protein [Campylobacter lari]MCR6557945.1 hypothetical protein [Campylobacter lari]
MINNAKDLEIFELCEKLAELLGDKEAIADLRTLEKRHPEMFVDKKQVSNLIQIVTKEPEQNLELMAKKEVIVDGRDAHTPYTQAQSLDGRLVQENISSATDKIISQENKSKAYFQEKLNNFNHIASKNKELEK